MLADPKSIYEEYDISVEANDYTRAEKVIVNGLKKDPEDPGLNARMAYLCLLTQREGVALDYLEKGKQSDMYLKVAQSLVNHFYCRSLMANRLKVKDEKGNHALERVKKIAGLEPVDVDITLSACLIVKNEAENLERCLKSIKPFVDEIIVVDTGSTDNTLEIAKKYSAKIDYYPWHNDFAAARNHSLKLASSYWALWIDADEEVPKESIPMIQEGLMRPQFGGYFIKMINYTSDHGLSDQYIHTPLRLFKRDPRIYFSGRIHEQIIESINALKLPAATLDNIHLYHYGYKPSVMEEKKKVDRTISMLEKELKENPKNAFHWFNLANVCAGCRDMKRCEDAAKKCIELLKGEEVPYAKVVYHLLTSSLTEQGKPLEALEICEQVDRLELGNVVNDFERALALMRLNRLELALSAIDAMMDKEWPKELSGDYSITTFKKYVLKSEILVKLKQYDTAMIFINQALEISPQFKTAFYVKGTILACTDRNEEALSYLRQSFQDRDNGKKAQWLAAHLLFKKEKYLDAAEIIRNLWKLGIYDEELLSMWAFCVERTGLSELAEEMDALLVDIKTNDSSIYINLARALSVNGKHERALELLNQSIGKGLQDPNLYFNAGDIAYAVERFLEAAEHYQAGLKLNPNHSNAWFTLGNAFYRLRIFEGAKLGYEQALRINPDYIAAKNNLCRVAEELKL